MAKFDYKKWVTKNKYGKVNEQTDGSEAPWQGKVCCDMDSDFYGFNSAGQQQNIDGVVDTYVMQNGPEGDSCSSAVCDYLGDMEGSEFQGMAPQPDKGVKNLKNKLKRRLNEQVETDNITDINFTNSTNCSGLQFMPNQGGSSNNLAGSLNSGTFYAGLLQYTDENNLNFTDIAFGAGQQYFYDTNADNACVAGLSFSNNANLSGTGGSMWKFNSPFRLSFRDYSGVPGYAFPHVMVNSWQDIVNAVTGQTEVQYTPLNAESISVPLGGAVEGYLSGFPLSPSEVGDPADFVANLVYGGVLPEGQGIELLQMGVEECNCPTPTENFAVDCYSVQSLSSDYAGEENDSTYYYTTVGVQNMLNNPLNTYLTPEYLDGECPNGAIDPSNFAYMDLFGSSFQGTQQQVWCVCYNEIMDLLQGIDRHKCSAGGLCTPDPEGEFLSLEACEASGCSPTPEETTCVDFEMASAADQAVICNACSQGNIPPEVAQLCDCCPSPQDVAPPGGFSQMAGVPGGKDPGKLPTKTPLKGPKKPTNVSPVGMAPQQRRMMREQVKKSKKMNLLKELKQNLKHIIKEQVEGGNITDAQFSNSSNCQGLIPATPLNPPSIGSNIGMANASGDWFAGIFKVSDDLGVPFDQLAFKGSSQTGVDNLPGTGCISGMAMSNEVNLFGGGGSYWWNFTGGLRVSVNPPGSQPGITYPARQCYSWDEVVGFLTGQLPSTNPPLNTQSILGEFGNAEQGLENFPLTVEQIGDPVDFVGNVLYSDTFPGVQVSSYQWNVQQCECSSPTTNNQIDCSVPGLSADMGPDPNITMGVPSNNWWTVGDITNTESQWAPGQFDPMQMLTYLTPEYLQNACPEGQAALNVPWGSNILGSYCNCYDAFMDYLQEIEGDRHNCSAGGCIQDPTGPFLGLEACEASGCQPSPEETTCVDFEMSSTADQNMICYACSQGNIPPELDHLCDCCPQPPPPVAPLSPGSKGDVLPPKPPVKPPVSLANTRPQGMAPQQRRMMREQVERMQKLANIKKKK